MTTVPRGDGSSLISWVGLFQWMIKDKTEQFLFKCETGIDLEGSKTEKDVIKFADWVTVNYWGCE